MPSVAAIAGTLGDGNLSEADEAEIQGHRRPCPGARFAQASSVDRCRALWTTVTRVPGGLSVAGAFGIGMAFLLSCRRPFRIALVARPAWQGAASGMSLSEFAAPGAGGRQRPHRRPDRGRGCRRHDCRDRGLMSATIPPRTAFLVRRRATVPCSVRQPVPMFHDPTASTGA